MSEVAISDQYTASLYLAIQTLTTVGYGDVSPTTFPERIFLVVAMLIGASIHAYVLGSICEIIASLNRRHAEFNNVMDSVNAFIR